MSIVPPPTIKKSATALGVGNNRGTLKTLWRQCATAATVDTGRHRRAAERGAASMGIPPRSVVDCTPLRVLPCARSLSALERHLVNSPRMRLRAQPHHRRRRHREVNAGFFFFKQKTAYEMPK